MTLPSNASTRIYPDNGPSGFTVMLPHSYEFERDEWEVALTNIVYPHTWTNTATESSPQGKLYVSTNTNQNVINLPSGNYRTAKDVFMGIKRALAKFGQKNAASKAIVDHFTFTESDNRMSITIDDISMHFGLDLDLAALLKPDTSNPVSNANVPLPPSSTTSFDITFNSIRFKVLGDSEELSNNDYTYTFEIPLDENITWQLSNQAFQTMYVYSDIVESQVVGDVRAKLLRLVAPEAKFGDVVGEEFVNPFYQKLRLTQFQAVEIVIRGDTGLPIPFQGGAVQVTLHFRKRQ